MHYPGCWTDKATKGYPCFWTSISPTPSLRKAWPCPHSPFGVSGHKSAETGSSRPWWVRGFRGPGAHCWGLCTSEPGGSLEPGTHWLLGPVLKGRLETKPRPWARPLGLGGKFPVSAAAGGGGPGPAARAVGGGVQDCPPTSWLAMGQWLGLSVGTVRCPGRGLFRQ